VAAHIPARRPLGEEISMALRLIISINAAPGKGAELAAAFKARCLEVGTEPGCLQFEVFQSVLDPDRLTLLELWEDAAALEVHGKANAGRAPFPPGLRGAPGGREDYEYAKR
jgi:quinol monooxygenase YgiN